MKPLLAPVAFGLLLAGPAEVVPFKDAKLEASVRRTLRLGDHAPITKALLGGLSELRGNQISDISALAGLLNLQELQLRETRVRDLAPLSALVLLERLNLRATTPRSFTERKGLIRLQELDLQDAHLERLMANNPGIEFLRD